MPAVHHQHADFTHPLHPLDLLDLSPAVATPAEPAAGGSSGALQQSMQPSGSLSQRFTTWPCAPTMQQCLLSVTGWPLLPILDAQGNPPPATAGSCPETIDTLIGWRETLNGYSTNPELAGAVAGLWTRLHILLQFYQTPGPSGAPHVQAGAVLPDCHAGLGEPYETEMMGRLAAAALPSSGREFGRCRW